MNDKGIKILLIFMLILAACTKEIPYNGEEGTPALVVNALMENDSTMSVYLERSLFFLDNNASDDQKITSGASITLTNITTGEIQVATVPAFENRYDFPVLSVASNSYRIDVTHSGYPSVSAKMTTAPKVILVNVDTTTFVNSSNEARKSAILKWTDPPGKNYYFIHVLTYDQLQNAYYDTDILTDDVSFDENNGPFGDTYGYQYLNFNDELFEGKTKEFEIDFNTSFTVDPLNPLKYRYELICLSEEGYNYHVSIKKASNSDFFSEPVRIFNNIENGYGIFTGFNRSVIVK